MKSAITFSSKAHAARGILNKRIKDHGTATDENRQDIEVLKILVEFIRETEELVASMHKEIERPGGMSRSR